MLNKHARFGPVGGGFMMAYISETRTYFFIAALLIFTHHKIASFPNSSFIHIFFPAARAYKFLIHGGTHTFNYHVTITNRENIVVYAVPSLRLRTHKAAISLLAHFSLRCGYTHIYNKKKDTHTHGRTICSSNLKCNQAFMLYICIHTIYIYNAY